MGVAQSPSQTPQASVLGAKLVGLHVISGLPGELRASPAGCTEDDRNHPAHPKLLPPR